MPLSVQLGLVLAAAAAFVSTIGVLCEHRGVVELSPVNLRRPVRSALMLFGSTWYAIGVLILGVSFLLHVGALALAPISLVQATIAGGLVLLAAVADRFFAHQVTRREWIGVALAGAGLAFLAGTLDGAADSAHSDYTASTLALFLGIVAALALAFGLAGRSGPRAGVMFGAASGLFWAASLTSIKALSGSFGDGITAVLLNPLAVVVVLASGVGILLSARSLQLGRGVPVIAVTCVAINTTTIAAGPIVFSDPLPDDTLALAARILAFAMVICAAAFTPPPIEEIEAERPLPA